MPSPKNTWNALLGDEYESKGESLFQELMEKGKPLSPKPSFSPASTLPFELITSAESERELPLSGLVEYSEETKGWECIQLSPYSSTGPLSVWKFEKALPPRHEDMPSTEIILSNEKGREVRFFCNSYPLYAKALKEQKRYRFRLFGIVYNLGLEEESLLITEGAILEKERQKIIDVKPDTPEEELPYMAVDLTDTRAVLQVNSCCGDILTKIEAMEEVTFHGEKGYRLYCSLAPSDEPAFPIELYAFAPSLEKYTPQTGDFVSGYVQLYAIPIAETSDEEEDIYTSIEINQEKDASKRLTEAMAFIQNHPELPLSSKLIISAFIHDGWQIADIYTKYFSKMIPTFRAVKDSEAVAVFVDTKFDKLYPYPDLNQEEMDYLTEHCRKQGCRLIRFQVSMTADKEKYNFAVDSSTGVGSKVTFPLQLPKLWSSTYKLESEKNAAKALAETVNEQNLSFIASHLDEEVHFYSHTLGNKMAGKITFLRYFTMALIRWQKQNVNLKAVHGMVEWQGFRRPAMALIHDEKVTAVSIFTAKNGFIGEIHTLPEDSNQTFTKENY